jgi:hypothetical protein
MIISSQDDTDLNAKTSTPQYPDWSEVKKLFFAELASGVQQRNFRGRLDDGLELTKVPVPVPGDVITWLGKQWIFTTEMAWSEDKPAEIDTEGLLVDEPTTVTNALNLLGTWPHDQEFPDVEGYNHLDTWFWKGHIVIMLDGKWEHQNVIGSNTPSLPNAEVVHIETDKERLARIITEEQISVLGKWTGRILPTPHTYKQNDAWYWQDALWVNKSNVWTCIFFPYELLKEWGITHEETFGAKSNDELNHVLEMATKRPAEDPVQEDKGAAARELMEQKAEIKRLRGQRLRLRLLIWAVNIMIVAVFGIAAYAYIQRDLVISRYSDSRDCSLKVGNLTITGKRTYSYPAYSLWGQRWVQESNVQEVTTINLPGSRLDILMDAEPKWIGYRFSDGERGTQILKPALKYAFVMDKGMAMATYGGFCQPLDKQQTPDDPKSQERTIIN